jgi:lipoprotein-releasing system ATP-binding protein
MSDAALRLTGIVRTFRQAGAALEILRGVDLSIAGGEMVALVGPSGAGKSTLLQIAGLLEAPDVGDVIVDGRSSRAMNEQARTVLRRHQLGFVYQFHHLLPEFTAAENIVLPQMIAGVSRADASRRAAELLASVGLAERADHRPARLSGGEQQRVAIVRAIANDPAVLFANEPTGNLDPVTADGVFGQLQTLVRRTGLAALIATHNIELARRMDRTLSLQDGKVVELKP